MAFQKGHKKLGGKKAGTPNKKTALLKDMILQALDAVGGKEYLIIQARNEPVAFMGLIGKILPKQIDANIDAEVEGSITVRYVDGKDES